MRFLLALILIAILGFAAETFFPWWTIAIIAFLVTLLVGLRNGKAFLAGFLGIMLMWLIVAFMRDGANDHILSSRMAQLFKLPGSFLFLLVGSVIGGLVGGLAGWGGATVRKNLFPRGDAA